MLTEFLYFAAMTNQQLVDSGNRMMDDTDQAIERSKKVGLSLELFFFSPFGEMDSEVLYALLWSGYIFPVIILVFFSIKITDVGLYLVVSSKTKKRRKKERYCTQMSSYVRTVKLWQRKVMNLSVPDRLFMTLSMLELILQQP